MKESGAKRMYGLAIIVTALVVMLGVGLHSYFNTKRDVDMDRMEYRTDIQPIFDRFGNEIDIASCFWKADTIGKTNFGPSSYWMKGFILLEKTTFSDLLEEYSFHTVKLQFESGMLPEITGFDTFKWCYNETLSERLAGAGFIGEFYLDVNHGILYFDLESN